MPCTLFCTPLDPHGKGPPESKANLTNSCLKLGGGVTRPRARQGGRWGSRSNPSKLGSISLIFTRALRRPVLLLRAERRTRLAQEAPTGHQNHRVPLRARLAPLVRRHTCPRQSAGLTDAAVGVSVVWLTGVHDEGDGSADQNKPEPSHAEV
eukprot:CAMPEP_0119518452 /NCGR_PEP_ID=MMETSP1344-20130328/35054_1 /TAXON_ID=236787 /ORGANISM="Florenciella parvula, Strain CCMP2471" /LENGTH=151 /DNA_ID=CAMNT_0007556139 /DNA_START=90 /DNA_END=546 /DNA_ORIENTATION=-